MCKKNTKLLFIISFIYVMVLSCSKSEGWKKERNDYASNHTIFRETLISTPRDFFNSHTVLCQDGQCPSAVGKIVSIDTQIGSLDDLRAIKGSSCSTFLIERLSDSFIVKTNAHCLPSFIKTDSNIQNVKCNLNIMAIFPQTDDFNEERYYCDKILFLKNKGLLDYAIIKFKSDAFFRRVPFQYEDGKIGIKNNQEIKSWTMTPSKESYGEGIIEFKECHVKYNTLLMPGRSHSLYPLFQSDCSLLPGNSGSVVLNKKNKIVGIFHSVVDIETLTSYFNENFYDERFVNSLKKNKNNFSYFTNASCMRKPYRGRVTDVPTQCLKEDFQEAYYINTSSLPKKFELLKKNHLEKTEITIPFDNKDSIIDLKNLNLKFNWRWRIDEKTNVHVHIIPCTHAYTFDTFLEKFEILNTEKDYYTITKKIFLNRFDNDLRPIVKESREILTIRENLKAHLDQCNGDNHGI